MKVGKLAVCLSLTACLGLFCALVAHADLYFENENVSKGIPHQPDGTKLVKSYFMQTASRIETGDGKVMITDFNSMMAYTLNPQNRSYTQMNLNDMPGMPAKASPADKEQMAKMMGGMMQMKVTPTEEKKIIEGYNCRKYLVDMAMMQGVYWVSKDVKGYAELRSIGRKMGAMADKNPMLRQMNIAAMIDKLDGFPVQTVNNIMGGTITSTLKKVEQKPLHPELFKVPSDYSLRGK
jgi:hypothetical protein